MLRFCSPCIIIRPASITEYLLQNRGDKLNGLLLSTIWFLLLMQHIIAIHGNLSLRTRTDWSYLKLCLIIGHGIDPNKLIFLNSYYFEDLLL